MSEQTSQPNQEAAQQPKAVAQSPDQIQLKLLEDAQEYFGAAHDYLAQAQFPGHIGGKIAGILNFLKFQYDAIKQRVEELKKKMENETKAKASTVDVAAAKAAVEAALSEAAPAKPTAPTPDSLSDEHGSTAVAPLDQTKW